jgi:hypothetical protein
MTAKYNEDKLLAVQAKVDEVKAVMQHNIEMALERGENIDLLYSKTEILKKQAEQFYNRSREVRCMMCRKNVVVTSLFVLFVLAIIGVIVYVSVK